MTLELIDDGRKAADTIAELAEEPSLALDLEAAGFHRYSDRLCLIQISTREGRDVILDPLELELRDLLRPLLENPAQALYMHGGDYDFRLLDRDLDIHPQGVFDTQIAAALLGVDGIGLAALLDGHFGVRLSKKYQRADWARRPLEPEMLEYAASDTRYLHRLADILAGQLEEAGRRDWAEEEFRLLEAIRWTAEEPDDPVTRVKGAHRLENREVARLREALAWRDQIARSQDRAPFRVAPDSALLEVARTAPDSISDLVGMKGMNRRVAKESGRDLVERVRAVEALADAEIDGYPPRERSGPGRPPPEVEELANRLKAVRNRVADELGLDRGVLLPNAALLDLAREAPATPEGFGMVPGVKRWQATVVGPKMLPLLQG
jgi:ribonuclease D